MNKLGLHSPNPTPPAQYPSIAEIKRLKAWVNLAEIARRADVDYGELKACVRYDREPPEPMWQPLRRAMLELADELRRACRAS